MNNQLITPTEYEALPVEKKEWYRECQQRYYNDVWKVRLMYAPIIPIKEELTVKRVVVSDNNNGWIRVEDRLPDSTHGIFIVFRPKSGVQMCYRFPSGEFISRFQCDTDEVTHWHPLPPPPTI